MKKEEFPLFCILMGLFFIICIVAISKPDTILKWNQKIMNSIGWNTSYSKKALLIMRVLGVILLVFGIIAVYLQFH